ncbi:MULTISPECIES: hypothetical protein [unclassified Devosia]|uniref:hypothetical protein n=1 Tax=unclassified Devosia TaxID=196773 RepID=UPI001ACBDF70|nr:MULTISPECIES: hypothetical protein [unclassified Devosia]MBN9307349.1 hypothetical protein [Devosia sp.]
MANAAMIFILYVVSSGSTLPDFTALASFQSQAACAEAAKRVNDALSPGQYQKTALCLTSDSLNELADKNKISQQ